jgi:hypothetical protein
MDFQKSLGVLDNMKTTPKLKRCFFPIRDMLLILLPLAVGVVFLLPNKVKAADASTIFEQPVNDTLTNLVTSDIMQALPLGLKGAISTISVGTVCHLANGCSPASYFQLNIYSSSTPIQSNVLPPTFVSSGTDVTGGTNHVNYVISSPSINSLVDSGIETFYFLNNPVLSSNKYYAIDIHYIANAFSLGTTSTGYTGCLSLFSSSCSTVTSLFYSIEGGVNLSFNNPPQYSINDFNAPSGNDFSSWTVQVSNVPTTTTPITLYVTTSGGTDSVTLPANSTNIGLTQNIGVPKSYTLIGFSTSTPTIYSAHAQLYYGSSTSGSLISQQTTFFGVFANGSPYTQGNFFTTSGFNFQSASSTAAAVQGTCQRYNGNIFAIGLCDVSTWLFIPGDMSVILTSFQNQLDNTVPFAYVTALKSQLQLMSLSSSTMSTFSVAIGTSTEPFKMNAVLFNPSQLNTYAGATNVSNFRNIMGYSVYFLLIMGMIATIIGIVKR